MDKSTILFVMGAMLVGFVLLRRSQKRGRLAQWPPVSPPPHKAHPAAGHHLDAPGAMSRWEVEMHELARDLAGQLDSKMVIVQQLMRDTERATERLEAAIHRAEQVGLWQRSSGQPDDEPPVAPAASQAKQVKPVRDWPNADEPNLPELAQADDAAASARATAALVDRTERVYRLSDQGLSHAAIADQLGEPLGEVELILSVRSGEKAR
jgi:hypothetical protein